MKNNKTIPAILGMMAFVFMVTLTSCAPAEAPVPQTQPEVSDLENAPESPVSAEQDTDLTMVDEEGSTAIDLEGLESNLPVSDDLSSEEIAGLLLMREEEKLAHDVYITLYEAWGMNIFKNIANSEQTHTDAVKVLLDTYGLEDPAVERPVGEFVNPDLQALYDDLTSLGTQSLGDALKVGAAVEEIDILDLEELLAQTDNADIQVVYENLLKGSRNHLRAFTSTLTKQTGENYEPQYLTTDAYQAIVGNAVESGSSGNGNRP